MATQTERQKIRDTHKDSWIAVNEGDTIYGKVADVTEAWSDQRNQGSWYPLLTIDLSGVGEATGYDLSETRELKVHCFGAVQYNEVMKHQPEVGEMVRFTYRGQGEAKKGQNAPELYTVRVDGRTDQAKRAYARIEQSDTQPLTRAMMAQAAGSDVPIETDDLPFS